MVDHILDNSSVISIVILVSEGLDIDTQRVDLLDPFSRLEHLIDSNHTVNTRLVEIESVYFPAVVVGKPSGCPSDSAAYV